MVTKLDRAIAIGVVVCRVALPQAERPAGFVSAASEAGKIAFAGTHTKLTAHPGLFLFPGDTLSGPPGSVEFFYCPSVPDAPKLQYRLEGTVTLGASPPSRGGTPVEICAVPEVARGPEVATLPAIEELLGPRSAPQVLEEHIRGLPPETRVRLESIRNAGLTDPRIRLAFGVELQRAGLKRDAAEQYALVLGQWKDQPALHQLIRDLVTEERVSSREIVHPADPASPRPAGGKGRTYALVVGISKYEQSRVPDLDFAADDARAFERYLRTPRGAADEVALLTDAEATSGAIRNSFIKLTTRAGKDDTVILLVAAHGDMIRGRPAVITHRSNPQDLSINSIPMSQIQRWMLGQQPFRRALVFLDVCHAGHAARFETPGGPAATPREYLMLLATHQGKDAYAFESKVFAPGHGAFTYFLLRGLNTHEARSPAGNFVSAGNLTQYVLTNVMAVTGGRQVPTPAIGVDLDTPVADLAKDGIAAFDQTPIAKLRLDPATLKKALGKRGRGEKSGPATPEGQRRDPELARRIELEDRGEEILLRYLEGEETPQTEADFRSCENIFGEALQLQPGSPYLEARRSFCGGRAGLFAKSSYGPSITSLERAIRLEPGAAYAYNALGIAYLQQSEFPAAIGAFQDAIQRAPRWAYARYNLAMAQMQTGDYERAAADLRAAMSLAPDYFYLPYGLGLLYQRINKLEEARESYRRAAVLAPERAEPLNGLGSVDMLRGRWKEAERQFRAALALREQLPLAAKAARHNLGLVLMRRRGTRGEAVDLWRENGDYAPSKIQLAEAAWRAAEESRFQDARLNRGAIEAHEQALKLTRRPDLAMLERSGNLYLANQQWAEACQALDSALALGPDKRARRRIESARSRCAAQLQ